MIKIRQELSDKNTRGHFRHVVDLEYRRMGVQYYQVHSYNLLHKDHFSPKVRRNRFVNI